MQLTREQIYAIAARLQDMTAANGMYHQIEALRDLALSALARPGWKLVPANKLEMFSTLQREAAKTLEKLLRADSIWSQDDALLSIRQPLIDELYGSALIADDLLAAARPQGEER